MNAWEVQMRPGVQTLAAAFAPDVQRTLNWKQDSVLKCWSVFFRTKLRDYQSPQRIEIGMKCLKNFFREIL